MPAKTYAHDLNQIEHLVIYWHRSESEMQVNRFFSDLRDGGALYSPSLGLVVEYNDWYEGDKSVGQTIDMVCISPEELVNHWNMIGWHTQVSQPGSIYYDTSWAVDLLADYHHISYYFDDDKDDADRAVTFLAAVCLAPDWTSEPYMVI